MIARSFSEADSLSFSQLDRGRLICGPDSAQGSGNGALLLHADTQIAALLEGHPSRSAS